MPPILRIFLVLGGALLASCLASPWIYLGCQALAAAGILPALADFPFHRYFSRVTQIAVIGGGLYLLWSLHIRSLAEFGLEKNRVRWTDLCAGVFLAAIPVAILTMLMVHLDFYKWREDPSFSVAIRIIGTAFVVGAIEEFLFRGVLLGLAVRAFGVAGAVVSVSLFFAVVHFLKPAKLRADSVNWASGFEQVAAIPAGWPSIDLVVWGVLTLFLAGLLLAVVTLKTRSLWLAIGIHAGWILGQQGTNWLAKYRVKPPEAALPWVGPSLVSGVVPTGILPLMALLVCALLVLGYFWVVRPFRLK